SIEIPFDLRPHVWEVVQPLTEDPNPTLEDERRFRSSAKELAGLALNTVRGLAMHAVIKYALWVRRHVVQEHEKDAYTIEGFDTLPEVREVLNQHLTLSRDSSLAVRSVYGQRFPWFVFLDQRWATQNISSIFPAEETFR